MGDTLDRPTDYDSHDGYTEVCQRESNERLCNNMKEERKQQRTHVVSYLEVRESGSDRVMGRVSEITTEGMKLQTREPMEPNTTLAFEMALPPHKRTRDSISFEAQVIWCEKSEDSGLYESGVQMMGITPEDVNEIRQIMEDAPFEHPHLNVHRPRRMEH